MDNNKVCTIEEVLNAFEGVKRASYISIEYTNEHGERAVYQVNVGISYKAALERSLVELVEYEARTDIERNEYTQAAIDAIRTSIKKSLDGTQDGYTKEGYYEYVNSCIQKAKESGSLEIKGLRESKKVLIGVPRKPKNSKPLTIEKDKINKTLSKGKYRTFSLNTDKVHRIAVNKERFEF